MIYWCENFAYMVANSYTGKNWHDLSQQERNVISILEDLGYLSKSSNGFVGELQINSKYRYDVFLGGTCNGSTWRNELIPLLEKENITYFNPVVDDWTPEMADIENEAKRNSAIELFVITPKIHGVYSIAEMMESLLNRRKAILVIHENKTEGYFDKQMHRSLEEVCRLVIANGGVCAKTEDVHEILSVIMGAIQNG